MENIHDYLRNGSNPKTHPEDWAKVDALINWVATQPELVEKVKQSVAKGEKKLDIIAAQTSFFGDENMIFINMKENPAEKARYLGQDGKVHFMSPEQSFAHELEHAIQDDPTPPGAALERAKKAVKEKTGLTQTELDRKLEQIESGTLQRDWGNVLLMEHLEYRLRYSLAINAELSQDTEYMAFVEKYEIPAIMAENKVAISLGKVPRMLDYFASGAAGKEEGLAQLDMKKLRKTFEKRPFALNPEPAEDTTCPIAGGTLEAINREQITLQEAGVSVTEDLSGCLLLTPDNVDGNREYRDAVKPRR